MASEVPMMEVYLPMMKAAALISAGELRVFEYLTSGPRSADEVAAAANTSRHGMRSLLEALVSFGALEKKSDRYVNSEFVRESFTQDGEFDFTSGLLWTAHAWSLMPELTAAVRDGGPRKTLWERMSERRGTGSVFAKYMETFARFIASDLQEAVDIPPGATRLLDIGGSHGIHSITFCQRLPQLSATILDLPESMRNTAGLIARNGLSDRITIQEGDALRDDIGIGYDIVLLVSLLHNLSAEQARDLIIKAGAALNPGGTLVVHEHFDGDDQRPFASAFLLTLLVEVGTTLQKYDHIVEWMAEAGLAGMKRSCTPETGSMSQLAEAR